MPTAPRSLKQLFLEVLALPDTERAAWLSQECAHDAALRLQLEQMLAAHVAPQTLLDRVAPSAAVTEAGTQRFGTEGLPSGGMIGPYKLLQPIGEGGMGAVYMAEQSVPVERRVALKIIKPGMDSRQVIGRFEAERQALAMMDHPNIAKVFDGGTTPAGLPYFVMELVHGVPITQYCDECQLTLKQRLELFQSVCQAVQHAHQKGIIHRDLKPSNVLVARYDERPVPKVIDFGVAKATKKLTERTMFTEFGQVVGTLEYMSPEQATFNQLDVDTRSDIYSLGVLLYELLTGCTPFDGKRLRSAAIDEMLRIIREEEPPKPSTRFAKAETLPSVAANRSVEPARLSRILRGELDWIVMKALDKDRGRRYQTTSSLSRDIERYLNDEPVQACPPSTWYRLRKFTRRHKGPVWAAAAVVLTLVAGIVGTSVGLIGEHRAKEESKVRLAQAVQATEILAQVFRGLDPTSDDREGANPDEVSRRLIEAVDQLEAGVGDPLVVARLQHVLGISLFELGRFDKAKVLLTKANQTRKRLLGENNLETADTQLYLALLYREFGDYEQAEKILKRVVALRTAQRGPNDRETLTSQHFLAMVYFSKKEYDEAETLLQRVLTMRTAELGPTNRDTLTTKHRLAALHRSQRRYDLSEKLHKEVLATRVETLGPDSLDTVATKGSLADLYFVRGKFDEVEKLYNDVLSVRIVKLGADHPDTLSVRHSLARLYRARGEFSLAEESLKEVLKARTARLSADHPRTLATQNDLAKLYQWHGKYDLAEPLFQEIVANRTVKKGADHPETLDAQFELATMYQWQENYVLAVQEYQKVVEGRAARLGYDHLQTLVAQQCLAETYLRQNQVKQAEQLYQDVVAICIATVGADHPETLVAQDGLAETYQAQNRLQLAEAYYQDVLDRRTATLSADHADTQITRDKLALLCSAMGKPDRAVLLLEESLEISTAKLKPDDPELLRRQVKLGEIYCAAGRSDKGLPLIECVHQKRHPDPHPGWVRSILLKAYVQAQKTTEANDLVQERVKDARAALSVGSSELAAELIEIGKWAVDAKAYAGAEPVFLEGYELFSQAQNKQPTSVDGRIQDTLQRLIQLYDAWGKPEEAAKWRKEAESAAGH